MDSGSKVFLCTLLQGFFNAIMGTAATEDIADLSLRSRPPVDRPAYEKNDQ